MNPEVVEAAIKALLAEIHSKLRAEQIAKAARACADAGSISESIRVSIDLDQLVYDVGRLHDAITVIGRLVQE